MTRKTRMILVALAVGVAFIWWRSRSGQKSSGYSVETDPDAPMEPTVDLGPPITKPAPQTQSLTGTQETKPKSNQAIGSLQLQSIMPQDSLVQATDRGIAMAKLAAGFATSGAFGTPYKAEDHVDRTPPAPPRKFMGFEMKTPPKGFRGLN